MNDEWNKGYFSTGPQRSHEARQGQFARQQEQRQEREAAARAAHERDQRFQDQMIRDALWTASQPAGTDTARIFGTPPSGKRSGGAVLAIAAVVLLFVVFGTGDETRTTSRPATPAHLRPPPSTANPRAEPTAEDALSTLNAPLADRSTAAPPMPPMDRFALRRLELLHGDDLDLLVSWQLPDGMRRAAAMDAFIVARDAPRHRIPLLERWSVFPGESTFPLALPAGLGPGKYELETVWTLGGEARVVRTHFTLLERPVVSGIGSAAMLPPVPASAQAPTSEAVASVVTAPSPAREPTPTLTPTAEQPPDADRGPPATLAPPPARPRMPANDPLYTGG